ncbi:hypothetical protein EUGRSUZ_K01843 [Eucalyptus grandis]|uniref:Uncharacterized protein n=2 Tax=Eucalyptus grandis TaxID=71139 RepID=A0ACC3IW26_EUCGR|nr:hypothetical protein EUGRSUZ_K01843 [Eucalyptus grandis]
MCLKFNYPIFVEADENHFVRNNSYIVLNSLQVTPDVIVASISNLSDCILYKDPFKLWKKKGDSRDITSFNSTFVLNITPHTVPGGEGLAFLITGETGLPDNSHGRWLGNVNSTTDRLPGRAMQETGDDNHVGLNVNSIFSLKQKPLADYSVNLWTATNITARVEYDGKNIPLSVFLSNETGEYMKNPIISVPLNLSEYLLQDVFLGFSAPTSNYTELNCISGPTLNWQRRYNIINGVAKALDYLRNGCKKKVLHQDVKASNIMLDLGFNARLGDFGLVHTIQQTEQTHHSTKEIAGTRGYMAPESFLTGRATMETDIYEFGILMLEVFCGREPGDHCVLADSRMGGDFGDGEMEDMFVLGLACCHPNPNCRPSMRSVLQVLTGQVAPPIVPLERPAFIWPSMPPSFREDFDCSIAKGQMTPITEVRRR